MSKKHFANGVEKNDEERLVFVGWILEINNYKKENTAKSETKKIHGELANSAKNYGRKIAGQLGYEESCSILLYWGPTPPRRDPQRTHHFLLHKNHEKP